MTSSIVVWMDKCCVRRTIRWLSRPCLKPAGLCVLGNNWTGKVVVHDTKGRQGKDWDGKNGKQADTVYTNLEIKTIGVNSNDWGDIGKGTLRRLRAE